uniref:Neurotransmitter-gated ion-channel transmembrane domain-containing protein n=1 Tax=Anopheles coluzzii TaxID=1518534 RepID=A0A8W7P6X4_ANOCL
MKWPTAYKDYALHIHSKPVFNNKVGEYVELTKADRDMIWVPDLYIRQLREMKMLTLFEEISSLRLYENSTISLSIGATIIIKCDMDFVLYPLDVQRCPVDFSSWRMVLLVTTLLSLITMFDTVRNNSPDALELKCLEVWLISCTLFVFFALMEYFIVLFGIRYDKHWRVAKAQHASSIPPSITLQSAVTMAQSTMDTSINSASFQRENGLEHATLKVSGTNKIQPHDHNSKTTSASLSNIQDTVQSAQKVSSVMTRKRFRNVADVALLYAGSQRGRLDQLSLIIFPVSFLIFTISYWTMYLTESKKNFK